MSLGHLRHISHATPPPQAPHEAGLGPDAGEDAGPRGQARRWWKAQSLSPACPAGAGTEPAREAVRPPGLGLAPLGTTAVLDPGSGPRPALPLLSAPQAPGECLRVSFSVAKAAREIRRRGGAGGAGGRLVVIYGRSDSRSWVASACPRVRAWVLGKPEGPPAPRLDQFRAAVAAEEGRGRRDLLTNVAVNTSGFPGELFQQAGRDRYFEWQATPFLTPGICGVPTALRRA
ncbi:unnamed protein product [Rangifer tarandus platyrhynchus]|uniref:Uncharacterized protein n=1 Tax=Rangifer tarandus platyrhynchus TaxID=3082113 RepID=A0AC59YID9_RANTA